MAPFKQPFQILINRERHGLTRRDPHYPWRNALIKCLEAFLFEHILSNCRDPRDGGFTGQPRGLLQSRFYGIDGRITQRPHGS